MSKTPGTTFDNGFIFQKINENENIKENKKILWAVLEGCTNRAWPIQPIGRFLVKLPKWHFLTNA
jgi:hypothetical protein